MEYFKNPDCLPLEQLKLRITNNGVHIKVDALNKRWAEERYFLCYEAPNIYNTDGSEISGAREHWLEVVNYIIEDLRWLLNLPFYRFWCNVIHNSSVIDMLVSFLQEAPPFYVLEGFPATPEMLQALKELSHYVLTMFARLVTNRESPTEFMTTAFLGKLLYNNYIFTIPIIFDICQLYGRENVKVIEKILSSVFSLQPLYYNDLHKSVPCILKALQDIELTFEDCSINAAEIRTLSERKDNPRKMTLCNVEDLILYMLDVSSTLNVLINIDSSITMTFHTEEFLNKLVLLYSHVLPELYKQLEKLSYNDESILPKYIELKHRLDVARIEMLRLYRVIIYAPMSDLQERLNLVAENEVRSCVAEYLDLLISAISEKEFIIDYHQFYPINLDLQNMAKYSPEIDAIKYEYILNSLRASVGDPKIIDNSTLHNRLHNTREIIPGCSSVQSDEESCEEINCINNEAKSTLEDSDRLITLTSDVKEILCNYDEDFIQLCLKHYDHDIPSVINAILENNLPPHLSELNNGTLHTVADSMESSTTACLTNGVENLSILDNGFDTRTQDVVYPNSSRIYRGKRREKYKNLNEMLNDKSEIKEYKEIYEKYSIIDDYDDEYDDTYDSHNIRTCADNYIEIDKSDTPTEISENEDEKSMTNGNGNCNFIRNPQDVRDEKQRRHPGGENKKKHDVVGKSRGQGQEKHVQQNRRKKNAQKASHGNHNRRVMSQAKRKQGMIPS